MHSQTKYMQHHAPATMQCAHVLFCLNFGSIQWDGFKGILYMCPSCFWHITCTVHVGTLGLTAACLAVPPYQDMYVHTMYVCSLLYIQAACTVQVSIRKRALATAVLKTGNGPLYNRYWQRQMDPIDPSHTPIAFSVKMPRSSLCFCYYEILSWTWWGFQTVATTSFPLRFAQVVMPKIFTVQCLDIMVHGIWCDYGLCQDLCA